ncbi:MAG: Lrp/AsnC family transcriptional regulator [Povalibacter sp.]
MIDTIDQRMIEILKVDARVSLKDLSERVGLSSPSTSERLRRLEERGIIRAFTVDLDPQALGYTLQAIARIRPLPGKLQSVQKLLQEIPECCECDKVTGDDCFIARICVRSIEDLDGILDRIADKAETSTAIVKSQPIRRRPPPFPSEAEETAKRKRR